MLSVALAATLAAMVAGGAAVPPPAPPAVERVPDEPGAVMLPDDEPTVQAVAADLDGDGIRELVRLVGHDDGPLWVEAWREVGGAWAPIADRAVAVPGEDGRAERAYAHRPVRLLVRRSDGGERVTLLRQPDLTEPDDRAECCLLLDDVVLAGDGLRLRPVAELRGLADAAHVVDMDGDGTDELFATRTVRPPGSELPTIAYVLRWNGDDFAAPTVTELPLGLGETPFVIGDSDGVSGDELAAIRTTGRGTLFRLSLGPDDTILVEEAGFLAEDALAVPLGVRRRGLAVVGPGLGLAVLTWPRGVAAHAPIASIPMEDARFIGVVDIGGAPRLLAHRPDFELLHGLSLPDLEPLPGGAIVPSRAAAALGDDTLGPYVGVLPGGGPDGDPAAIVAGRMVPAPVLDDPAAPISALADGLPIGLVGRDRGWLAIQHGALFVPQLDPAGGRLELPVIHPSAVVTLAPLAVAGSPEGNGGSYEPATVGAVDLGGGITGASRHGFVAEVHAPPGTRVYLPNFDQPGSPPVRLAGTGDRLDLVVAPPPYATANVPGDVALTLVTPAGHTYISTWNVRIVDEPPDLRASAATVIGSGAVTLTGRTAPYAEVEVAGTPAAVDEDGHFSASVQLPPWPTEVSVVARDPLGNEATLVVSGIGFFDYRALPWIPIGLVLLGGIAVLLLLRVPRPHLVQRPVNDDAVLEELDPADRL